MKSKEIKKEKQDQKKSKDKKTTEEKKDYTFVFLLSSIFIGFCILASILMIDVVHISNLPLEENGGLAVNIQDQTTRLFDIPLNQVLDNTSYSISTTPIINSYDIELNSTVGLSTGDKIAFLEQNGIQQIYFGQIISISVNTITLNSPVPYNFTPTSTIVFTFDNQLNVDGSTNVQTFSLCNFFNEPVDITRIIFTCTDNVEMHDGLFCGAAALTRGIEFRKLTNDGYYINYFNVKNNAKWGLLAYDTKYTDKGKPPDDTYGFSTRLTFGGQNKHGVVIRLEPMECIEVLIQDDQTDISSASLIAEGHFTLI